MDDCWFRLGDHGRYLTERWVTTIERFTCLIPASIGATLGWLCAALAFLNGFRNEIFTVFLSLAVFYIVTLWGTRRWPELRIRLLLSVFCGGILGAMLCPAVSRVLNYENATLAWFLDPSGPLDVVVSALFCGFLFTLVPILLAPRNTTIAR